MLGEIIPLHRSMILPGGLFYVIGTLQSNFLQHKKRLLRLSEKTSITRVTTSVRFRARAGKPWEVHCDTSTL